MVALNGKVFLDSVLKDYIENLASSVPTYKGGPQAIEKFGIQNIQNGVPQGLNFGLSEISDFQNQYNSGAGRNNPINIPKTTAEIELARQGKFNDIVNNNVQEGGITEERHTPELNKFKQALLDMRQGFIENRDNAFSPENWSENNKKSIWNRIGEIGGTTARIAQNPVVQGAATGILTGALTGSPMFGLTNGFNMATAKQNSNMYKKQLADNNVNVDTGLTGMLNKDIFNSLLMPKYKETENNTALARIAEQQNYHNDMTDLKTKQLEQLIKYQTDLIDIKQQQAEYEKLYKEIMAKVAQQNANTAKQNADTNSRKANIQASKANNQSKQKNKTAMPQSFNSDLAQYSILRNNENIDFDSIRAKFVGKYGVDPEKYLK